MADEQRPTRRALPRRGIPLLRVAGFDVRLDYSWFLIFALVLVSLSAGYLPGEHPGQPVLAYWLAGGAATLLFFVSIVVHEISHAIVARIAGIHVSGITLFLFGGVSELDEEASTPKDEFRIAIVGPLTSFALAALFWGAHRVLPEGVPVLAKAVVLYLAWINAALGIFNLLPGFPLDGGRVLRALAWWKSGSLRSATRVAADAGKGLAVGLMLLGGLQIFAGALLGGLWLVFIGMFLRTTAEAGYQSLLLQRAMEDARVEDVMTLELVTVSPQLAIRRLVDEHLLEEGHRAYPVVEDGTVVGLIGVGDLKDLPAEDRGATTVAERMQRLRGEMCVSPDAPVSDAMKQLAYTGRDRLLVMQGDQLRGMFSKSDLSRFLEIRQLLDTAP